jgi:hypothetical protein
MDYLKLYNRLIASRKLMNRRKGNGFYYESHHIIPISIGGEDINYNKVLLTGKEHFLAHLLLVEIYSGTSKMKMWHALNCMLRIKSTPARLEFKISAKQYDRIKIEIAKISSILHKGKPKTENHLQNQKGFKKRQETIDKMLKTRSERNYKHSDETKAKIKFKRQFQKINGKKIAESRIKNGTSFRSDACKEKMRNSSKNKKPVIQMLPNGVFVRDFDSLMDAAKYLGVTISVIHDCINGRQKTSKGFSFKLKSA